MDPLQVLPFSRTETETALLERHERDSEAQERREAKAGSPELREIFYDAREVYGGY